VNVVEYGQKLGRLVSRHRADLQNVAKIISSLTLGLGKAVTRAAAASGSQMVKSALHRLAPAPQTLGDM
jgi:hypothetical protein